VTAAPTLPGLTVTVAAGVPPLDEELLDDELLEPLEDELLLALDEEPPLDELLLLEVELPPPLLLLDVLLLEDELLEYELLEAGGSPEPPQALKATRLSNSIPALRMGAGIPATVAPASSRITVSAIADCPPTRMRRC